MGKKNNSVNRYIAVMARKHHLDPNRLVDALVEAWKDKRSRCGSLDITCRGIDEDSATLLLTKDETVISQLRMKLKKLLRPSLLKRNIKRIKLSNYPVKKIIGEDGKKDMTIGVLKAGMRRIDIKGRIIDIPPVKEVITRFGTRAHVTNVLIADKTARIKLTLWNDKIKKVHVGDLIEVKNGYVAKFAGETQLRIGRKGAFSIIK